MVLAELVPAVLYGVLAFTIPESPRYLIARGEMTKAKEVLTRYVGGDVEKTSTDILKTVEGKSDRPRFRILRSGKFGLLPIVWVGIGLSVLQQFTGINVIFYYSTTLWQAVGFTESDSLTITVITSVTNIVTTIIAIMLIDRVGRKPLLLVGAIGQFLCLAVLTLMFATATIVDGQPVLEGSSGTIALVAANLYVVFFGASWGPVVWVLLGEMFSNKIRAVALSVAAAAQWAANFVISTTFPALAAVGLGVAYGVYTFFAFVAIFFVIKFVRETKGRTLESMTDTRQAQNAP
jgi:SP family sugar:H+ symporter-like MFS transporter